MSKISIRLKRVYEPADESDGLRILVDRMWPRGMKKSSFEYDIWAKDVTPSLGLRRFFHVNPKDNWEEFARRYDEELAENEALDKLADEIRQTGATTVTLLYGFRDPVRNHAVVLRNALMKKLEL